MKSIKLRCYEIESEPVEDSEGNLIDFEPIRSGNDTERSFHFEEDSDVSVQEQVFKLINSR